MLTYSWETSVKMPCDFTNRKQTVHAVHALKGNGIPYIKLCSTIYKSCMEVKLKHHKHAWEVLSNVGAKLAACTERQEKRILYQLARGIQAIQARLTWLTLFTLKAPETLCHRNGTGSVTRIEAAGALSDLQTREHGTGQRGAVQWPLSKPPFLDMTDQCFKLCNCRPFCPGFCPRKH